jgi:hypothetical protein
MATKATTKATKATTTTKGKAAPKAAPKATTSAAQALPAQPANAAQQAVQPQGAAGGAPLYTYLPYGHAGLVALGAASPKGSAHHGAGSYGWQPVQAGSIRAHCRNAAQALAKAHPNGFTVAQYAQAIATQPANGCKQPAAGWGIAAKGYPNARTHAAYFAKQGWLVPVPMAQAALAKAKG